MITSWHPYLSGLDYKIFTALNNLTGRNAFLDYLFILCAVYFAYIIPLILLAWWFAAKDRILARKAVIMAALSALVAREVVKTVITFFWARNRPFIAHVVHNIVGKSDNQASFPSGHAIAMFSIAAAVYSYDKRMGTLMYVMAVLTGFGRIIVGVHYPSDIIGGAILGMLTGWLMVKFLNQHIDRFVAWASNISDRIFPFTKRDEAGKM